MTHENLDTILGFHISQCS